MGTEKKKEKKEEHIPVQEVESYQQDFIENKVNCTEAETILFFYLKFILAGSLAQLNSLIDFTHCKNMLFFKKHGAN